MKKIFLLIIGFLWLSSTAQTNTWIGPNPGAWSNAAAWSLGVPTSSHDVVIPSDAAVTVASAAQAKTLTIANGATLTLSNTLTLIEGGIWDSGAIINWTGGSLTGSGNLLSSATINLTSSSSKSINGGLSLQNSGTISILSIGDLFMSHGTLTNLAEGNIILQTAGGDITYTGTNPHLVTNQGTIRATASGSAFIEARLQNQGTIQVESGSLIISHPNTQFEGGIYNVFSSATLFWRSSISQTGILTGTVDGSIGIEGIVSIAENNETTWNFTGNGEIFWNNGTLRGPGTLINNANVNLSTSASKIIDNLLNFTNNGVLRITSLGDLFINNGIVNNAQSGLIDLQADNGNITYNGVNSKILNNAGTIRRSTSGGIAYIEVELANSGTLEVMSGTLTLNNPGISLVGGTYSVNATAGLVFQSTVTVSGSLSGMLAGQIVWQGNISVPAGASFDFETENDGAVMWSSGTLTGGGNLTNNSTLKLISSNAKSIVNQTTLSNGNWISIESIGDLFIVNGILNNLASGILNFAFNGGDITYTGTALHQVNNLGTIRNLVGSNAILADLVNQGIISVDAGVLNIDNVDTHLMGGTYNVSPSAELTANSPTCSLALGGVLQGTFRLTGTVNIPVEASLNFSGPQPVVWSSGSLTGGGELVNNHAMHLLSNASKSIIGGTQLTNAGMLTLSEGGDLFLNNGRLVNQTAGTVIQNSGSDITYTGTNLREFDNLGLLRKTAEGSASIFPFTNNSGVIEVSQGTLSMASALSLNNQPGGVLTGIGSLALPVAANFTNQGTVSPGGSPGTLTLTGQFESESSSALSIELNGLVPGTGHDLLTVSQNAVLNGQVEVILGFFPSIDDSFTVLTTGGTISACNLAPLTSAFYGGLSHTFAVTCQDNNKVVLTLIDIVTAIPLAQDQSFCAGASVANLVADGQNIQWYSQATGGSALDPGSPLATGAYFVSQTINGFESDRLQVQVTVFSTPAPVAASPQNFIGAATVGNLAATGTQIRWYDVAIGGTPLDPSAALSQQTYYATQTLDGCESIRVPVVVTLSTEFPFYADNDNDGFGAGPLVLVPAQGPSEPPAGYSLDGTDCDDTDELVWQSGQLYVDADGDGYDNGLETVCYGAEIPAGYASQTLGADCDDSNDQVWQGTLFYVDADGDSFGSDTQELVCASAPPAGYATNNTDCDDTNELVWQSSQLYVDADGDGYDNGLETVCYGAEIPAGYASLTLGADCNDSNDQVWQGTLFYVDADGDSFGSDTQELVCASAPPAGYATNNTDCDDTNELVWQSAELYVDTDGDGYDSGLETVCYGAAIPAGYDTQTLGSDCDDNDEQVWQGTLFYVDADGDLFGSNVQELVCASAPPAGYATNNTDCDDTDELVWQSGQLYVDADGDGYDNGLETVCYGAEIPTGYASQTLGADCNDSNDQVWQGTLFYVDADGDGYDNGLETVCYGAEIPAGYASQTLGADCDDADENVNPDATEIPGNGIDENCNGNADDDDGSGEIISYVLPGFCGTTLSGINTTIGIYSYPGATAYRIRAINQATLQQTEIVRTVPHFKISMFPAYAYAATYSISVEVQLAGVWSGYFGPGCVISTPQILAENGPGQITPAQCGITLATMNTLIATTSLAGVTGYRFKVTDTGTLVSQTIDRPLHWFSLPMLANFRYGTSYQVEVAFRTNGDYTAFGFPCTVSTPAVPTLKECGKTIASVNENIQTVSLQHVTKYRFKIEGPGVDMTIENPLNYFTFNQVPGFTPGAVYSVSVSVLTTGIWSPFGNSCTVTAPAAARDMIKETPTHFTVTAWPNPFSDTATLGILDAGAYLVSVKVFDMTGKLLDAFEVNAGIDSLTLGERYPAGVYTVSATCQQVTKTVRIIKR